VPKRTRFVTTWIILAAGSLAVVKFSFSFSFGNGLYRAADIEVLQA
jgi:hypothetical protein